MIGLAEHIGKVLFENPQQYADQEAMKQYKGESNIYRYRPHLSKLNHEVIKL